MNVGGWEGLDMTTICLDMLLGLPRVEMAGWGGIYRLQPPIYSLDRKQQFSVDGHTGQSGAHRTRHCSVSGACHVSRPLESTIGFVCPCGAPDNPVRPDRR
jgi:hypothetical protein